MARTEVTQPLDTILGRLAVHLQMEQRFTPDYDQIVTDLQSVNGLIQSLEQGNPLDSVTAEANTLLGRYSFDQQEVQIEAQEIMNRRFSDYVPVPHTRQINRFNAPAVPKNNAEQRTKLAEAYSFSFEGFAQLLNAVDFWQKIGPQLEQVQIVEKGTINWDDCTLTLDHPQFSALMNVINGSSPIDYEAAFPELQAQFDQLKRHKYHLSQDEIDSKENRKSPLSVPDILSLVVIDRQIEEMGIDPERKREIAELNARILDDQVPNSERIEIHQKLKDLYYDVPTSPLTKVVNGAIQGLMLPDDHRGNIRSINDLQQKIEHVDVVVPLGSSDDGLNAEVSRRIINTYPTAFLIPSGGRAPHEAISQQKSSLTEADLMIAIATAQDLNSVYLWKYPDLPNLEQSEPLSPYEVLAPDASASSTQMNASETTLRLQALQDIENKTALQVVVVTNNLHASRALIDFQNAIKGKVRADVAVFANEHCPLLSRTAEELKIHGMQYMFGEYVKHLYMTSMDQH